MRNMDFKIQIHRMKEKINSTKWRTDLNNTTYILLRQNIRLVLYLQRKNILGTTFTSHLNFTKMSMPDNAFHIEIIDAYT